MACAGDICQLSACLGVFVIVVVAALSSIGAHLRLDWGILHMGFDKINRSRRLGLAGFASRQGGSCCLLNLDVTLAVIRLGFGGSNLRNGRLVVCRGAWCLGWQFFVLGCL